MLTCLWIADEDGYHCERCGSTAKHSTTVRSCRTINSEPRERVKYGREVAMCVHRGSVTGRVLVCDCPHESRQKIYRCELLGVDCATVVDFPAKNPGVVSCLQCEKRAKV